jgi:hypothetical protein
MNLISLALVAITLPLDHQVPNNSVQICYKSYFITQQLCWTLWLSVGIQIEHLPGSAFDLTFGSVHKCRKKMDRNVAVVCVETGRPQCQDEA